MAAAAQKNRLGRGLASLIGDLENESASPGQAAGQQSIPISQVKASSLNPRRDFREQDLAELASSIRQRGLVQPVVVRPAPGGKPGYELVAGERRWRAAQRAGIHDLPAIVRTLTDKEALEIASIENVQRADLNAIEEAGGSRQLLERFGYTQEELADVVGKSRSHLTNTMRLLKLPDRVQALVRDGQLSAGHARALIGREDAEKLAKEIVRRELNVRDVEALVRDDSGKKKGKSGKARGKDADTRALENDLADALGLKVDLKPGRGEAGELRIRYRTLEQLEDVTARLTRRPSRRS
ncbi:MAG: ParB/RepB/Spo0J family partition protein [Pseudomonadota bacterium]|nr:ParB/RepB/Spo0J family partition protein [Pseudomonadota bacterium]